MKSSNLNKLKARVTIIGGLAIILSFFLVQHSVRSRYAQEINLAVKAVKK